METNGATLCNAFKGINMKQYDDDDDFQDENLFPDTYGDDDDDLSKEEYVEMMARKDALEERSLELAELDLNQKLLFEAMKFAERYPNWEFKSQAAKLKMVAETYKTLKGLLKNKEKSE